MYGNTPLRWDDALQGDDRWRLIINALTRLRFCTADGTMEFQVKEGADAAPPGFAPWFRVASRRTAGTPIAFGHWSTLGLIDQPDLLSLDTGCVWGGSSQRRAHRRRPARTLPGALQAAALTGIAMPAR